MSAAAVVEAEAAKTAEVQSGFRERDVVTLTVIATHENLPAGVDELPPVYTPYQDKLQREEWFVFLVNENEQIVQIGQFPGPLKRTVRCRLAHSISCSPLCSVCCVTVCR